MNEQRWQELMNDTSLYLTKAEADEGWHFCDSFDGLLIHPLDPESRVCFCGYRDEISEEEVKE